MDAILLRPLPFPQAHRLVSLGDRLGWSSAGAEESLNVTVPEIPAYARDTRSFASLGGYQSALYELSGAGLPVQVHASRISAGVFQALGVAPALGRVFTAREDAEAQAVAVLSYATWKSRFNANAGVVGSKILVDRKPYVVIGVMPKGFEFPLIPGHLNRNELWVPLSLTPQELALGASDFGFRMIGRLRDGVTVAEAQADAEGAAQAIMRSYPANLRSLRIQAGVEPLQETTVKQARPLVRTLFLAVTVVLLMACTNLAGLLLVRAIRRQREIAVCQALGASTATLVQLFLLESFLLSAAGGLLGIALAAAALDLGKHLLPESLPRVNEIGLNLPVAGFALLLALLTGLLCGLAPAFAALRTNMNAALKDGGRSGTTGGSHARLRSMLVVAEVAVSVVLLIASGLLLRSFERMRAVELGFQPEQVVSAAYSLPRAQYRTQVQVNRFNAELLLRLGQLPGTKAAGLTTFLPAASLPSGEFFTPDADATTKPGSLNFATPALVEGEYFRTMGIPLLRGRLFTDADREGSPLAAIVNRTFAEHYWPGQDPVGRRMRIGSQEMQTPWLQIVGEVADVKEGAPDGAAKEQFYAPVRQAADTVGSLAAPDDLNGNSGYMVLRSSLPPEQVEAALGAAVRSIDPQLPLTQVERLSEAVAGSEAPRRFNTVLMSGFAGAAVLLAVLGMYSVLAFTAASRVQEMAIRLALGAPRSAITGLIFGSAAKLAAAGCGLGLAGAAAASGLLHAFLFGVSPFDPPVLVLASAAILLLALAAAALPAVRAAGVDPIRALRGDASAAPRLPAAYPMPRFAGRAGSQAVHALFAALQGRWPRRTTVLPLRASLCLGDCEPWRMTTRLSRL